MLAAISEPVILSILALIGGCFSGLVAPVVMFVLKDRADRAARKEAHEEAQELALLTQTKIAQVHEVAVDIQTKTTPT